MRGVLLSLLAAGMLSGCGSDGNNVSWDPCCAWHRVCMEYCLGSPACDLGSYTTDPEECRMYLDGSNACVVSSRDEAIADCTE